MIENPIWKTSYRLVLDKEKEDKPFLQGWAMVENPTDEDWKDVRMALVSGRPISFQMDLYNPLYVPRPIVEPELFASLRPVAYSGNLDPTAPHGRHHQYTARRQSGRQWQGGGASAKPLQRSFFGRKARDTSRRRNTATRCNTA